jgi:hypothetical protein
MFRKLLLGALLTLAAPLAADAANRFAVCTTACTWDAADTSMWSTTTGGGTGASVPGSADVAIFDGATCVGGTTCTITVGAAYNPTIQQITFGACTASTTGCVLDFSVNNNSPTLSVAMVISGTGTRSLKMGSGTFTFTTAGATTPWDAGTTTNLTWDRGTSTLYFNGGGTSNRNISGGSLTYHNITFDSAAATARQIGFLTSATIAGAFACTTDIKHIYVQAANTLTLSGTLACDGTSTQPLLFGVGTTNGTISVAGALTAQWWVIFNQTVSGAGTLTLSDSYNVGGATGAGLTVNNPTGGAGARGGVFGG